MSLLLFYIVRNLFYSIGDLPYQSPLVNMESLGSSGDEYVCRRRKNQQM